MTITVEQLWAATHRAQPVLVQFAQDIIAIPSLSGHEDQIAARVQKEMQHLEFDDVQVDQAGNVIGVISGGTGPSLILNGHMDHVDAGVAENWPHPPFEAKIVGDQLWGRGSVDMKGPVACMIYAAALFKKLAQKPAGNIYVTVAVMEEIGGLGSQFLTTHLGADIAICGEPSHNTLRRGHRGRVELQAEFLGQSAHASTPHLGVNPHFGAAAFLQRLGDLSLPVDDSLGQSTVVPTLYHTDQISPNVIPGAVSLTLDWRNVPGESPEDIVGKVRSLLADSTQTETSVAVTRKEFTTYTGMVKDFPSVFPSFILPQDDPVVQRAHAALVAALGRDDGIDIWRFATDGGHLMAAGIPTVGFGPGDETLAHTIREQISLAQMEEAVVGYGALINGLLQAE